MIDVTLSAADRVGNGILSPQFRLVKDSAAPTAEVYVPAQPALAFRVNWQGQDALAGVAYYDLQYREKEAQDWGNWLDWQTGTQETSARFVGQAGYEYQFRVRAADRVGNLGEWVTGSLAAVQNVTIYYYAGSVRVAMRQGERVTYLLADHLGSTQVTADEQGSELGRYLYTAWGETRQVSGETATDRLYTGQRQEAEIGLYYYNARWYDPALGRFTQADTIVPNSNYPLAYDRYAYAYNNPIRYNDPSGHFPFDEILDLVFIVYDVGDILINGPSPMNVAALAADLVCAAIPYGTGGGLAIRAGGEAAMQGVLRLPAGARALQLAEKFAQFATGSGSDANGLNLSGESSNSGVLRATENSKGEPFPTIIDPRTNQPVAAPPDNLTKVPLDQRVEWGTQQRYDFIKEWYDRGYSTPDGGWDQYEIHHIIPREYGGTNAFDNLVPVRTEYHQNAVNNWWKYY